MGLYLNLVLVLTSVNQSLHPFDSRVSQLVSCRLNYCPLLSEADLTPARHLT